MHLTLIDPPMHQINEGPAVVARASQAALLRRARGPTEQTGLHRPSQGLGMCPFMGGIQVLRVVALTLALSLTQKDVLRPSGLPLLALKAAGLAQTRWQQGV
jgi:hypothetical protein